VTQHPDAAVDPDKVIRGQQRLIEAQRSIIDNVRALLDEWVDADNSIHASGGVRQVISVEHIDRRFRPLLDGRPS
jgi:hypothetical protein